MARRTKCTRQPRSFLLVTLPNMHWLKKNFTSRISWTKKKIWWRWRQLLSECNCCCAGLSLASAAMGLLVPGRRCSCWSLSVFCGVFFDRHKGLGDRWTRMPAGGSQGGPQSVVGQWSTNSVNMEGFPSGGGTERGHPRAQPTWTWPPTPPWLRVHRGRESCSS